MSPNVEIPQVGSVEQCAMLLLAENHTCFDPSIALRLAYPLEILGTKLLLASPEHPLLFGTSSYTKHDYPSHDDLRRIWN